MGGTYIGGVECRTSRGLHVLYWCCSICCCTCRDRSRTRRSRCCSRCCCRPTLPLSRYLARPNFAAAHLLFSSHCRCRCRCRLHFYRERYPVHDDDGTWLLLFSFLFHEINSFFLPSSTESRTTTTTFFCDCRKQSLLSRKNVSKALQGCQETKRKRLHSPQR